MADGHERERADDAGEGKGGGCVPLMLVIVVSSLLWLLLNWLRTGEVALWH